MERWLDLPPFGQEERKEIGRNIRKYRKRKKWTQEDLAEAIGKEPTMVSKHECAQQSCGIDTLAYYAIALGCLVEDLLPESMRNHLLMGQDPLNGMIEQCHSVRIESSTLQLGGAIS